MEQVLDIYERPNSKGYPVVCMDESPKQLIKEARYLIPMKPVQEARIDFEYERCGVANIFLVSEPLSGKRFEEVTERKTKIDWALFIKQIADKWYNSAKKITPVMDNLGTHKPAALYETFEPIEAKRIWDKFDFIYTPRHGSWLNMAEKEEADEWQEHRNNKIAKIDWQFQIKDARIKLKHLYPK